MVRRLLLVVAVAVLVASACAGESDSDVVAVEPAVVGPFRGETGATGTHLPILDDSVTALPFVLDQVRSSPVEAVPSALRGDRDHPSFPAPLVALDSLTSGGRPPDGIPAIDSPRFQHAASVGWLGAVEPVVVVEVNDETRAYPLQILTWHEIVNDTIGGVPVAITYCPLCNSALAYDRRLGDRVLDFGTSGELFNSSLVMYDRQTESLWTHFDSTAVIGHLAGEQLETFSVQTTSWEQYREAHPESVVLSRVTGFDMPYGRNPYMGYDNPGGVAAFFDGETDPQLPVKERVIVVRHDDAPAVVLPLSVAFDAGAFVFEAHGRELVAFVDPGVSSPLDGEGVDLGYDQGAAAVFVNELDGRRLDVVRTTAGFTDRLSGVTFDIFGEANDGSGRRLDVVEHLDTFWFAIAAFEPDAQIVDG
ncbi:MAG: DUF3179 domain-containing protein [Actinomycetota bacterium]